MLDTFSVLTLQLARAFGIFALAAALAALATPKRMGAAIAEFERSPGLTLVTALFSLMLGIALVMLHSLWTDLTAVLVSLIGWAILLKSILLLAAPDGLLKLATAASSSPGRVRIWGMLVVVLAVVFLVLGLAGHAIAE